MFVFSSILVAATWFVARLVCDRVFPCWRTRPERRRRRFAVITGTGATVAAIGFGAVIWSLYGVVPALIAAACLVPVYVFIAVVLGMLLSAFEVEA